MSSALDETASRSGAQAYLALLADRGVDYLKVQARPLR
jgi:hypothetical protein